jgi:hypothetical protein
MRRAPRCSPGCVTARAAAPAIEQRPTARPFHDLLIACLEHRFSGDVAIGTGTAEVGDDDIRITPSLLPGDDGAVQGPS